MNSNLTRHHTQPNTSLWNDIQHHELADQTQCLNNLSQYLSHDTQQQRRINQQTITLIESIRAQETPAINLESFLQEYQINSREGAALMCLAEALLRIPDQGVAQQLVIDKIIHANWQQHLGCSESFLVNASTRALNLSESLLEQLGLTPHNLSSQIQQLTARLSEPLIMSALKQAMHLIAHHFVYSDSLSKALQLATKESKAQYSHSFDMLGEEAITAKDATRYFQSYYDAISSIAQKTLHAGLSAPGISIKLSALNPRFEFSQRQRVLNELSDRLTQLATHAHQHHVPLTIDAEESHRMNLTLELFQTLFQKPELKNYHDLGLAIQTYSKRAMPALRWLRALAITHRKRIAVRLVKGAYWDSEIKWAQQQGLSDYPVFTEKAATDLSYLSCAKYLLGNTEYFYPQFATHNAHTATTILSMASQQDFEFQRLHGMGDTLYQILLSQQPTLHCRIYAPVGQYRELLPYLVRRLLENSANTSFVHQVLDKSIDAQQLAKHPIQQLSECDSTLAAPTELYSGRKNSAGINFASCQETEALHQAMTPFLQHQWKANPIIDGQKIKHSSVSINSPFMSNQTVGECHWAHPADIDMACHKARHSFADWRETSANTRANNLLRFSDLLEKNRGELIALCAREAGKTLPDAADELREAVDFARYYAQQCSELMSEPRCLEGVTGEINRLYLKGRGVFVCISPWNFPLAIFCGQICAALAAGNCVLAKPAEQTPLCAHRAVTLLHEAGIPLQVLHFLPGEGPVVGKALCQSPLVDGVAFTGSTETAQQIQQCLCSRGGAIATFIAETGGQNALIADSSALPQQLVSDAIQSAFFSAGQRCSALRVLYVQEDIADHVIELIIGAMNELHIGNPLHLATDIGPVIDREAQQCLDNYIDQLKRADKIIHQCQIDPTIKAQGSHVGHYVAPTLVRLDNILTLKKEHFGPILHLVRYHRKDLDKVIKDLQQCPWGLTFGIHSRNEHFAKSLAQQIPVGNVYINRNIIGATVGAQPFGGQRCSGTGPKAGGPHYLPRFCTELTVTQNTTAMGGNLQLLSGPNST